VFRRFTFPVIVFALVAANGLFPHLSVARTQDKNPTSEAVAEGLIYVYGSRTVLEQVRRNGSERGRLTRLNSEGRTEEATYERRFKRGENSSKDKIRLDQKSPTLEYALVYGDGRTWGLINGAPFTPRQEATTDFLAQNRHSIDALLRYKEDGSTLALVGKEKHMGLDLYVLDMTDKENQRTRFYISAKTARVLWLEYEQTPVGGSKPVKYMKKFYDYRNVQGTLVPYRTVLFEDGKQVQESRVMTVTYGLKMEDSLFQNPETPATASQP
jgi:hypothetical protein